MLRKPKTHRHYFKNSANQKYQSIFFQEIAQRKLLSYVYIVLFMVMFIVMFIPIYIYLHPFKEISHTKKFYVYTSIFSSSCLGTKTQKKSGNRSFLLPPI